MSKDLCLCQQIAGPDVALHPRCFGQVWLFEGAPPDAWNKVASRLVRKKLSSGDKVFFEREVAETMYLIKMGSVKLWKSTEDGRELILDIRNAGDLLGEAVLIEAGTYPVCANALSDVLLCGISRPVFEEMVHSYPQVGLAVIKNLSRRIDYLTGKLGALNEPTLEERLYEVLLNVARQVGVPGQGGWSIALPLTHEEIGFLVGAHRVSITRAMKKLRETGKINSNGKILFIAGSESTAT